jgi:hypothetical protein
MSSAETTLLDPMNLLTFGLLVFAGVQVWLQHRVEQQRRLERKAERDAEIVRAFQLAWSEHFRLDGLARSCAKYDLIEMALLGVLRPGDVLPRDWGRVIESLTSLSPEAGYLGAVALSYGHEVERAIATYVASVAAFAEAPGKVPLGEKIEWIRKHRDEALAPWEKTIREHTKQLALILSDAAAHNPQARDRKTFVFHDDMESEFARIATEALRSRADRLAANKE